MLKKIQLLKSGIPLADKCWNGLYRGGCYLLVGPGESGKTLLSLQYAIESANQNEMCLYFTSASQKDLMIKAASIHIDLQQYLDDNKIIVVKVVPPHDNDLFDNSTDELLVEYLKDIISVIKQYKPSKIVFDELTSFVEFKDFTLLRNIYSGICEKIDEEGITSLFVLSEPAALPAQIILDLLTTKSTGTILLKKLITECKYGEMIITPNIGHAEGQFKSSYKIEHYKGLVL